MPEKQANFTLMGGRVKIVRGHYNPTSDAVWLAASVHGNPETILDVGIGTGGAGLCALVHNPSMQLTGIDVSPQMLADCAHNAGLNNRNIELINTDILTWRTPRTFDLVITNPPYFRGTPARHNAHHNIDLGQWVRKCAARVRPRGYFCIIIDAAVCSTVIAEINSHFGDIEIFPLYGAKRTAERVIIRARAGTHGGTVIHSGFAMNYNPVLRDGLTIDAALARLGCND